ncbi:MAG: glycosyltransferase, partial [Ilumatobacter sp.]
MSSNADGLKYDFELSPTSTYARAARLVSDGLTADAPNGCVVDLGAGVGVLGQALAAHGVDYVACEYEPASVDEMRRRGVDAHVLDLTADDVVDRILQQITIDADRPIVAVTALDVVEHLPDPERSAEVLAELVDRITAEQSGFDSTPEAPMLVLSIPNVAHFDLGAKLMTGRWDITDAGLLDRTHISLFTERRLAEVFDGYFAEIGRDDVEFAVTEQRFELDDPIFAQAGLGAYLRHLRERSDDAGERYQFVRSYRRRSAAESQTMPAPIDSAAADEDQPFCSVVVRTQGERMSLVDTLTTLAGQTDCDIEVLLLVHHADGEVFAGIESLVDRFDPDFAGRVNLVHLTEGGRSAPLNAALDLARGRYLAVVDDDDVVTCDWIATFRALADQHPGAVLRSGCVVQSMERRPGDLLDFEVTSGFSSPYPDDIDMFDMIRSNR